MSCTVQLTGYETVQKDIGDIEAISDTYTVTGMEGSKSYVNINVCDMPVISQKIFTVEYDPTMLEVVDLCGFTSDNDTTLGQVPGADVTVINLESGKIVFDVNKNLPNEKTITGTINRIVFKKLNGNAALVNCMVASE